MTVVSTVDLQPNLCHCFCYCFLHLKSSREKIATLATTPGGWRSYLCSRLDLTQPRTADGSAMGNFLPAVALLGCAFSHRPSSPAHMKMCSEPRSRGPSAQPDSPRPRGSVWGGLPAPCPHAACSAAPSHQPCNQALRSPRRTLVFSCFLLGPHRNGLVPLLVPLAMAVLPGVGCGARAAA